MSKSEGLKVAAALQIQCRACFAPPGFPCTVPTSDSRRPVHWVHAERERAALEALELADERKPLRECTCHRHVAGSHEQCCGHTDGRDPDCPHHGDGYTE